MPQSNNHVVGVPPGHVEARNRLAVIPSGSEEDRVFACPTSGGALAQVRDDSDGARVGSAKHQFAYELDSICRERDIWEVTTEIRDVALARVPEEHRKVVAALDHRGLYIGPQWGHEITYALDMTTGNARCVGRGLNRDYGGVDRTREKVLTLDVVGVDNDTLVVVDFKSEHDTSPHARQVELGMVAAARHLEWVGPSHGVLARMCDDGEVRDDPPVVMDDAARDMFWIEVLATEQRRQRAGDAALLGAQPFVAEGAHCRYCPSKLACPAKVGWLLKLERDAFSVEHWFSQQLTADAAAKGWTRYRAMQDVLTRVRNMFDAYAKEHPFEVGDGVWFGVPDTDGNESLDGDVAFDVLREIHGEQVALAAVELRCTKTALRKALRSKVAVLAPAEREVLAKIRERGGSARSPPQKPREHRRAG